MQWLGISGTADKWMFTSYSLGSTVKDLRPKWQSLEQDSFQAGEASQRNDRIGH